MAASSFKKVIGNTEYVFYRTKVADDIVYFALFGGNGSRTSVRMIRDLGGKWTFASSVPDEIKMNQASFFESVERNET